MSYLISQLSFLSKLSCLLISFYLPSLNAAVWTITYPKQPLEESIHVKYPIELLELALAKTGVRFEVQPTDDVILQGKAFNLLSNNRSINILWSMTNQQREADFLPIRVPIFKGLIGWRVLLIDPSMLPKLESSNLRDHAAVQGMDWPDTKVLQSNGFNVVNATSYDEAFTIMHRNQADIFPRSVIEVLAEMADDNLRRELILEPNFVLQYPSAIYFFVNKRNKILAKLLEQGFAAAVADGTFDALFNEVYLPLLKELKVSQRQVMQLSNPLLPLETPLDDEHLWYSIN